MEAFSCLVCKYGRFAPPPNENNKLVIQFPFLIASFISCRINSATWESFKSKKTILKKKNYTSAPFSSFFPLLFLINLRPTLSRFLLFLLLSFPPLFLFGTFLQQFIGVSYFTSIWSEGEALGYGLEIGHWNFHFNQYANILVYRMIAPLNLL